jgi:hypothetical protein
MRILIYLFISKRIQIRIQGAKQMRILADPDPCQTLESQKVEFAQEKIKLVNSSKNMSTIRVGNADPGQPNHADPDPQNCLIGIDRSY